LPSLRGKPAPGRLPDTLEYVGIAAGYAIRNFARRDEVPEPEFVCIILPTTDLAAFARGDRSDADLLRGATVFAATRDDPFASVDLSRD
jgi:hypothetical protein